MKYVIVPWTMRVSANTALIGQTFWKIQEKNSHATMTSSFFSTQKIATKNGTGFIWLCDFQQLNKFHQLKAQDSKRC